MGQFGLPDELWYPMSGLTSLRFPRASLAFGEKSIGLLGSQDQPFIQYMHTLDEFFLKCLNDWINQTRISLNNAFYRGHVGYRRPAKIVDAVILARASSFFDQQNSTLE